MGNKKIDGNVNIKGNVNLVGGSFFIDGSPLSLAQYDGIRFQFADNNNYTLDVTKNFASYIRLSGQVMVFIASFYITKDTIGTGSNPIIVGSFTDVPNEVWEKIVASANEYVDEQDIKAFVDGSFASVGSKMALIKNENDHTLDLLLETTNMENDVEYHIRYESVLLSSNNIAGTPKIVIENLGSQDPLNVTFSEGMTFPTGSDLYQEVTIDNNVFIKFPIFYKKTMYNANNELIGYEISKIKLGNDYVPYDCFLDEQGNELPYILVGKYNMSSTSIANSVNATPTTMPTATARSNARALGTGYQLFDCAIYCFIRDLAFAVEKKFVVNKTSVLGLEHLTNETHVDGISSASGLILNYSNKPSSYVDTPTSSTTGYTTLSYGMSRASLNNTIQIVGCDPQHPTICLPRERTGDKLYETYYCAPCRFTTNTFANVTMLPHLFQFTMAGESSASYKQQRLCYRPIN